MVGEARKLFSAVFVIIKESTASDMFPKVDRHQFY